MGRRLGGRVLGGQGDRGEAGGSSNAFDLLHKSAKVAVPTGAVYSALQREVASCKRAELSHVSSTAGGGGVEGGGGGRGVPWPGACGGEQGHMQHAGDAQIGALEASLDDAKTSNRLLSRALAAVQQRLKQVESERDQLRRERDYFRNLALRFPFTLSPS
jgi:hypothetical protein